MSRPDLNLLFTLDVLLAEGSVASAARRLQLSPSAMSRALSRLRQATGDPLLVRAGRGLIASPRALELRDAVAQLVHDAEAALRPATTLDLAQLERTFTVRASEGFVENFGAALLALVGAQAPGARLHFRHKLDKDRAPLRDGSVDLETGVVDKTTGPEVRTRALFSDRYVGVVRTGHPLCEGDVTAERYASASHVRILRQASAQSPLDDALSAFGIKLRIGATVGGFAAALALVRGSELVASVPERHTGHLLACMHCFALPVPIADFTISMLWHPRMDGDPAHRWLRACVRQACGGPPMLAQRTAPPALHAGV